MDNSFPSVAIESFHHWVSSQHADRSMKGKIEIAPGSMQSLWKLLNAHVRPPHMWVSKVSEPWNPQKLIHV